MVCGRRIALALLLSNARVHALLAVSLKHRLFPRLIRSRSVVECVVPSCDHTWHEVQLSGNSEGGLTLGQSIEQGETVIVVPGIATAAECSMLAIAAKRAADDNRRISGVPSSNGDLGTHAAAGRIPSIAAAESCARAGAACVAPLPIEADRMADSILNRVLSLIDREMPTLVTTLFGPTAESLVVLREMGGENGALGFHAREPAINVYDAGGEFLPHMVGSPLQITHMAL